MKTCCRGGAAGRAGCFWRRRKSQYGRVTAEEEVKRTWRHRKRGERVFIFTLNASSLFR